MAITTANAVADYLLCEMRSRGDIISNLQLQKLLYYTQAWFLAIHDQPLFGEPIKAWAHGPVETGVYHRFKEFSWRPITADVTCPTFPDRKVKPLIKEVISVYGCYTGVELEALTHREDPWRIAWEQKPSGSRSPLITHESMKTYYRGLMRNGKEQR